MKTTLGNTDLEIRRLGFGAMNLSLHGRPPEHQSIEVIHRVLELGFTLIDTADSYCIDESEKHHNERLLNRALAAYQGDTSGLVIATKGGNMRPGPGEWVRNGKPDHLREAIRESHAALGREGPIQLWQHHAPDPKVPVERSLEALREAVDEGIVQHVGVSNYSVEQIEKARDVVDIVSVQNKYNPWHRRPEEDGVLEYCEREGITFIAYSPLGGTDRAKTFDEYQELSGLAEKKRVSPQRLVLAWLVAKSPAVVPIVGATRISSVEDSAQATDLELGADEIQQIDNMTAAMA